MLDSIPVSHLWIGIEPGKLVNSVGDVWPSASAEIHERIYSIDAGDDGHLLLLF